MSVTILSAGTVGGAPTRMAGCGVVITTPRVRWHLGRRALAVGGAAAAAVVVLVPLLIAWLIDRGRARLVPYVRLGRWGREFRERRVAFASPRVQRIAARSHLDRAPSLLNVLRGEMHLVGPRPLSPGAVDFRDAVARARLDVVPGIVSLAALRQRANMLFDREALVEREYVAQATARADLGVLARALVTSVFRPARQDAPSVVSVLGLDVVNVTTRDAIDRIVARVRTPAATPLRVGFLNAHYANVAMRDRSYRAALDDVELLLGDGIGVRLAGMMLGTPVRENVNGTDLFPRLCAALAPLRARVFLLGAAPGVAAAVAAWVQRHHPGVVICGTQHGYFDDAQQGAVLEAIRAAAPDIVLVAMGAPRQEVFLSDVAAELDAGVIMGVGGLFDFFSGRIPRAPAWMRELGIEWVFRLWQEPGRMWRRYVLGNAEFIARVGHQRVRRRKGLRT